MRGDAAALKLNNHLNKMNGRVPDQVKALQMIIRHAIELHGFVRVLVLARTSPSPKPTDDEGTNNSIEKQIEYLGHMLAKCDLPVHWEKAAGISASKGHAVDRLEKCLQKLGKRTLVLTTRVDRVTRSVSEFERLQKVIGAGDHGIISSLWDFETSPENVCLALRLPEAHSTQEVVINWETGLKAQKRAPMVRLNRPLHQPLLWMFGTDTR